MLIRGIDRLEYLHDTIPREISDEISHLERRIKETPSEIITSNVETERNLDALIKPYYEIFRDIRFVYEKAVQTIMRQFDISREAYEQAVKIINQSDN
jgi:hypothetical protein